MLRLRGLRGRVARPLRSFGHALGCLLGSSLGGFGAPLAVKLDHRGERVVGMLHLRGL